MAFTSCEKEREDDDNPCSVVDASLVPQMVRDSFAVKYPALSVTKWFNKDNIGFCAFFSTSTSTKKLAQFANDGSFVKEEVESDDQGDHKDNVVAGKVATECECEVHEHRH